MPVEVVRWLALVALALCGLGAFLAHQRDRDSPPDPAERIKSRYKHLIVPVEPFTPDADHPPIDVSSIDALAQLAERSERLILHDHQEDVDHYLIDDQGTLFRFSAPRAPTAHLNGNGRSGAQPGPDRAGDTADQPDADPLADAGVGAVGVGDLGMDEVGLSDSDLGDPDLSDPAAAQAAAILSSAAATLRAAAASATISNVDEADAADEPHDGAPGVPEDALTQPPDDEVRPSPGTEAASPADGPAAAPVATRVRTRPLSLREIDNDPPPTMTHWSRRPQYRVGLTIGPLALTFLVWRRLRARRRRMRGDDLDEQRRSGSWTTRNLVRR